MYRRFLNIVSHEWSGIHSLHRVNLSKHLFYRSTAEARAAGGNKTRRGLLHKVKSFWLLPGPEITFRGAQAPWSRDSEYWFSLLGGGDDRILFAAVDCQTALYNADLKGIAPMPNTHSRKGPNPICLSMPQADLAVSQSLYVLDKSTDTCFEVLARTGNDISLSTKDWCWHTLEQPPFRFDRNFEVSTNMYPHSVVDSRTICVSSSLEDEGIGSPTEGTHLFENSKNVPTCTTR
jgi:hypothetical protein